MFDDQTRSNAIAIARFITDHKGADTVALDISETCSWADCFVITTVNSMGHLRGVTKELWGFLAEMNIEVINRHKSIAGDGWELIDCGSILIHLMSAEMRSFYDLEKLWHQGVPVALEA